MGRGNLRLDSMKAGDTPASPTSRRGCPGPLNKARHFECEENNAAAKKQLPPVCRGLHESGVHEGRAGKLNLNLDRHAPWWSTPATATTTTPHLADASKASMHVSRAAAGSSSPPVCRAAIASRPASKPCTAGQSASTRSRDASGALMRACT